MGGYFKDLNDAVISTLKGMSVTLKHLFSKPVTVQYPDEKLPVSERYRGRHKLTQGGCRACGLCAKVCPVECIDVEFERHMKRVIEFKTFTVDYNRCIFCGLCTEACNPGVIKMTQEFDLSTEDRAEVVKDLLEWRGLRPEDLENIRLLKEEEEKKKAAGDAAAAAGAGAPGDDRDAADRKARALAKAAEKKAAAAAAAAAGNPGGGPGGAGGGQAGGPGGAGPEGNPGGKAAAGGDKTEAKGA